MVEDERRREVDALLTAVGRLAGERGDIAAAGVAGSWAREAGRQDSDVDLILLTENVEAYVERDDWISGLGALRVIRRQEWGAITERRLLLPSGLEVEVGIGSPIWAHSTPVDAGTRRVVRDGFRVLYDPRGLLEALVEACSEPNADTATS